MSRRSDRHTTHSLLLSLFSSSEGCKERKRVGRAGVGAVPSCQGTGAWGNFPPKSLEIFFLLLSAGAPQGERSVAHTALLTLLPLWALHWEFMAELSLPTAMFCSEGAHVGQGSP